MDVVEHDDLPPLPRFSAESSPRRLRRRPPISSTISENNDSTQPPSLGPDQIISNLIDSLTAISQTSRDQSQQEYPQEVSHCRPIDDLSDRPPSRYSTHVESGFAQSALHEQEEWDHDSDGSAAAPPVIRYSRAPPKPSSKKKTPQLRHSRSFNNMIPEGRLSIRNSIQSLRSQKDAGDADLSTLRGRNGSIASLAYSMMSTRTSSRRPSPARTSREPSPRRHPERSYSDPLLLRDAQQSSYLAVETSPNSIESQPNPTLSPLHREKLEGHLIPSRQSSVRKPDRRGHHRHSTGSRDLQDLKIDEELISADDSTVRRIKELQEAKAQRHSEWRKDSRPPSDTPSKRHSAPNAKALRRSSTYQSSKLSVTEVLIESEHEAPQLSAQMDATDLAAMPALVAHEGNSPLTPIGGRNGSPPLTAQRAASQPASVPTLTVPTPPKDRMSSNHNKRASFMSTRTDSRTENLRGVSDEVETFLAASRLTQKLRHPRTGRTIAFSEVGDPDGFVVFCCVGMGLTRYVMAFYDELARTLKLRLITPDRPGVGESEAVTERFNNPLTWVDDVAVMCEALGISRFSLLAHSAGTIYAMATALKMPQFVRGRIHLLAPWIPPSQMIKSSTVGPDAQMGANMPMAHRILSVLPAPILKLSNAKFLSSTSAGVDNVGSKYKPLKHVDMLEKELSQTYDELNGSIPSELDRTRIFRHVQQDSSSSRNGTPSPEPRSSGTYTPRPSSPRLTREARASLYNSQLTHRIWSLATQNANPVNDLMTCLERKKTVGFRYADVTRSIVIRHGAKDTRVPLENVKWLDSILKRCELRVLEHEGHSLMASAGVMSNVLSEISKEWEEWDKIARYKEKRKKDMSAATSVHSARV